MLKLLADAAVLMFMVRLLLGDDAPEFAHIVYVALGMAVANLVIVLVLAGFLGLLVVVPVVIVDTLILMYFCYLDLKYAAITMGALLVYNVAWYGFWLSM